MEDNGPGLGEPWWVHGYGCRWTLLLPTEYLTGLVTLGLDRPATDWRLLIIWRIHILLHFILYRSTRVVSRTPCCGCWPQFFRCWGVEIGLLGQTGWEHKQSPHPRKRSHQTGLLVALCWVLLGGRLRQPSEQLWMASWVSFSLGEESNRLHADPDLSSVGEGSWLTSTGWISSSSELWLQQEHLA